MFTSVTIATRQSNSTNGNDSATCFDPQKSSSGRHISNSSQQLFVFLLLSTCNGTRRQSSNKTTCRPADRPDSPLRRSLFCFADRSQLSQAVCLSVTVALYQSDQPSCSHSTFLITSIFIKTVFQLLCYLRLCCSLAADIR
jgi:hypothetical protein